MKRLIDKYTGKLTHQGLAGAENITLLCLDAEVTANRPLTEVNPELLRVFDLMNINALLYAEPEEPYKSIIRHLATREKDRLIPNDCENRTFLHDIPIISDLSADTLSRVLSRRKAAIVGAQGIISFGTVSPEQAFVSFSSVCFSTFVKFFTDVMFHLENLNAGKLQRDIALLEAYEEIIKFIQPAFPACDAISKNPPQNESEVVRQMIVAGKELVERRLVDSNFGNISYTFGDNIYISQTGSSLDELETCIDAVPLDGSSSSGITASSELSAHICIFRKTGMRAILHGHPRFTVIMSMSCRKDWCDLSTCYSSCSQDRSVSGIPIVSGEIGTGPSGLFRTVPEAMAKNRAVVVFGHGIFSAGIDSFGPAFELMQSVEKSFILEYFNKIRGLI
jgi:ribulose-5-phosphate 4-epimerase/fuculose-1-phosphate aldolase